MGEGNRRIARGLYERASQSEKREASEFYEKLKSKRDGKIRALDFNKGVESSLSKEKIFKQLDLDGDGFLDFDDVLLLFYHSIKKAITILRCRGCSILIYGTAHSCFQCFFNTADHRFSLCHDCNSTGKKELEKMWEEAKCQAGTASPAVEGMADNYFKSMGSNNRIDIKKFSSTLTKQQEKFLTPRPDSEPETNYMKNTVVGNENETNPRNSNCVSYSFTFNSPHILRESSYSYSFELWSEHADFFKWNNISTENGDYHIQNSGNGPHHSQPFQHVHYHVTIVGL
ncbi:hypothetical protein SASPL_145459 [Salvia splendens]|uniref:EF-hand domain-containing protein n=1 Tax=Salvia splendens TaxID=180675 RepID=A0A8X8WIX9_SALSN|nr:hypothetical protein SASPL_145459 [Salvia splendens]